MKEIKLTNNYVTKVDDDIYDYLMQWKWKSEVSHETVYAVRNKRQGDKYISLRMHRVIMGDPTGLLIDHIDSDGLNNQRSNLRICSDPQNRAHRRPNVGHKYIGVGSYKNNLYRARIRVDNITHYLGYFKTEHEAALAYNEAAIRLKGDYALLNVVDTIYNYNS